MVSSNHTIVPVCSFFHLGDHVILLSLHLQYISCIYYHLMVLMSVLLRITAAINIELCIPCHEYFHPPVQPCALVCRCLFSGCYYWWKQYLYCTETSYHVLLQSPTIAPFSFLISFHLPPESFLSPENHSVISLFLKKNTGLTSFDAIAVLSPLWAYNTAP